MSLTRKMLCGSVNSARGISRLLVRYQSTLDTSAYLAANQVTESNLEEHYGSKRPIPLNVELNKYAPLKHEITHGHLVGEVQFRSYTTEDLDFFCNFALRAAFYLQIPVRGATPLPRRTERWTVIRSPFAQAKSKENFERRTSKRLIKLYDANPTVVDTYLSVLREYAIPGVGMKANVYGFEDLNVTDRLDEVELEGVENEEVKKAIEDILGQLGAAPENTANRAESPSKQ